MIFELDLAALNRAMAVDSTDVRVLWRLARAYVELGKLAFEKSQKKRFFTEAMTHGQAAIAADSMNYLAYTWLAISEGTLAGVVGFKQRIKLSWQVRDHALKAIELKPEHDEAYHVLARWHFEVASIGGLKRVLANLFFGKLPEASYEESMAYYRNAIERNDLIHHRLELVKVYLKTGMKDEAQAELEHILIMENERRLDAKFKEEAKRLLAELR